MHEKPWDMRDDIENVEIMFIFQVSPLFVTNKRWIWASGDCSTSMSVSTNKKVATQLNWGSEKLFFGTNMK